MDLSVVDGGDDAFKTRVAGKDNADDPGLPVADYGQKVGTGHAGHLFVGNHYVDVARVDELQGLKRGPCEMASESGIVEGTVQSEQYCRFVIDEEDSLLAMPLVCGHEKPLLLPYW
jgi:hypothetical protein